MKSKTKNRSIRRASQIFFFVLVGVLSLNHFLAESGAQIPIIGALSVHAICPFGGVETFFTLLLQNQFVQKLHMSTIVILGIIMFLGVLFGPVVCSYMCPLGSIQEWIGKIGKKIFKKRYNRMIPRKIDGVLRYLRYFVLIYTVYLTTNSLKLVFLEVDPYYALYNFWNSEATIGGIIVLVVTLLLSLVVERPWCKYACPFGALMGLTNFFRIFKIRRNPATCISCNKCSQVCPMNIDVDKTTVVKNHQCISCYECTSDVVCPLNSTMEIKVKAYKEIK